MLDIGWSELLIIGVVALIVVGPRDLPKMFRALGRITAKARGMAREFSSAMEDAARDTGIDEAARSINDIKGMTSKKSLGVDALDRAAERFEKWEPKIAADRPGAAPKAAASGQPASPPPSTVPAHKAAAQPDEAGRRRLHAVRRSDTKDV